MINYVDDALYYANSDKFRMNFELLLKKGFNLTLTGNAKWYLWMRIRQGNNHIMIDLNQYIKNSSWNVCIDTDRSTGGYRAVYQGGAV